MYSSNSAMNMALTGAYLAEEDKKRREAEVQPRQDNLLDTIGKIALAAGATAGAVVAGRRLAGGQNTSATFDLSKLAGEGAQNLRRAAAAAKIAPKDVVLPSRPVPTTGVERQRQVVEDMIRARSERPQRVVQGDLVKYRFEQALGDIKGLKEPTQEELNKLTKNQFNRLSDESTNLPLPRTIVDPSTGREIVLDPFGVEPASRQAVYSLVAAKPKSELPRVYRPDSGVDVELITDPNTGEIFRRGKSPASFSQQYLKQAGYAEADTLVDQQVSSNLNQVDQFVNAVNSSEDQQTGRVKLAFQRNEDENLAAIEMAEDAVDAQLARTAQAAPETAGGIELDAAINTVASQRPDGMPVDQAEGITSAQRFLERERSEIASQLGEQNLPITPGRVEQELANRVAGSEAWKYGPKYTQRKQALQLGATYDPRFFENVKTETVTIAGEQVPVSSLKEPVAMEDTALRLQERAEQKRDWLGSVRLEEQKNKVRLDNVNKQMSELESYRNEVANFLRSGRASSEQRQLGQQRLADISLDLDRLDTQRSELANRVFIGEKRIAGARRAVEEGIASLELPQKLKSGIEEGQRIFFEVDPKTGQPIPGTQELRSEKYAIDLEPKAGGGRQVAEFDPEGQSGQVKDIYGIRLASALPDDPETRPSKPGPSRTPLTQEITPERLESFDVSRQLRQLQTSGRPGEAQAFLDKIMKQRGISGATGSFSLL